MIIKIKKYYVQIIPSFFNSSNISCLSSCLNSCLSSCLSSCFKICLSITSFLIDTSNLNSSYNLHKSLSFFDLANNEKLLNKLQLYYIQGNYGTRYTYESRAKWFYGYLSSFSFNRDKYKNLLTNPEIRLLVEDKELLTEIKSILNPITC